LQALHLACRWIRRFRIDSTILAIMAEVFRVLAKGNSFREFAKTGCAGF
jgi:hypothetical protein